MQRWVFGAICPAQNRGFFEFVDDRERATLFPIIQREIAAGSIIHSDCWSAYVTDFRGPREHRHIEDIPVQPPYVQDCVNHRYVF